MTNEERDKLLIQMSADMQEIKGLVSRHDHSLYGNGQPGLVSRVQTIEQRQVDCPARAAHIEGRTATVRQGWLSLLIALASAFVAVMAIYR